MSLTVELPAEVEDELRKAAARVGKAPEELVRSLVTERYRPLEERALRIGALLDQWDAEDEAHPEAVPVMKPLRTTMTVPDCG